MTKRPSRAPWAIMAVALVATPLAAASSPVATNIVADTLPGRSVGTAVSVSGSVVTIGAGTLSGPNLFESFAAFSLGAGQTAQWSYSGAAAGAAQIINVINRVTGGAPSQIDGTLTYAGIPRANFFFINPAGVIFGPGAGIDLPAAAFFSTASFVAFGPGETVFSASSPQSTLSMAQPVAFGFLGREGDLIIDGQGPSFLAGAGQLSLSAANLHIQNVGFPTAGVRLGLFAVGSQAMILPLDPGQVGPTPLNGDVVISDAEFALGADQGAGPADVVFIDADTATFQSVRVSGPAAGAPLGGQLALQVRSLVLDGAEVPPGLIGSLAPVLLEASDSELEKAADASAQLDTATIGGHAAAYLDAVKVVLGAVAQADTGRDADILLRGQCGTLAADGRTSRMIDQVVSVWDGAVEGGAEGARPRSGCSGRDGEDLSNGKVGR